MTNISQLEPAMKAANDAWGFNPLQKVRMPMLENQRVITEEVDALWTDRGLRPNASNLAFLMQSISGEGEVEQWTNKIRSFPVRGSLLVSPNDLYLVEPISKTSSELEVQRLNLEAWYEKLNSSKPHLFTPKALSKFRQGQLSLADSEETVSARSLIFYTRQQAKIDDAFQKGVDAALKIVAIPKDSISSRSEIKGHIIRYAIAYLAARILQDKNFFGSGTSVYSQDQDPQTLLNWMVDRTNGFFKRTMEKSAPHIHQLEPVLEQLAHHMGVYRVSFALTDHLDVGTLYERAIKRLPPPKNLSGKEWSDLNRHYTPVKIAERMLEALPLERLRPEERYIFDPAAGSGSLLLAATSRLAGMTDIPINIGRKTYLESHVAGNDRDEYAKLIAKLRYFLASESLGRLDEQITDILPFPSEKNFTCEDYEILSRDALPVKPKVIIANPPFVEEGNTQKAAKFVQKALEWLDSGSQFAFVLPQSFLAGTTHGFSEARELVSERCQLLEVWQIPERSVGINAEQAVCVVTGIVGQTKKVFPVSSKAVFSRVKEEVKSIRQDGFLGTSWLNNLNSTNLENRNQFWQFVVAPHIPIGDKTILLGELFYVFNGITPKKSSQTISTLTHVLGGKIYKRNWRLIWRDINKLWADPMKVPDNNRWIEYSKDNLKSLALPNANLFDIPKILIARKVNRGSRYPLAIQWDDIGFCPDNNVYCVLPALEVNKYSVDYQAPHDYPIGWLSMNYSDKCLWLLGICTSRIANSLSLIGRKTHEITVKELCRLPLPFKVDREIIDVTRQIIDLEKQRDLLLETQIQSLRQNLDHLVEKSYGNPSWKEITRVGKSPELEAWQEEKAKQTKTAIGQVLEISEDKSQVFLYISRLMDDDDTEGEWIPLPQDLPGWALDGTPFEVQLSHDIKTFAQLTERPWALRKFRHEQRAYLTGEELEEFLTIPELEVLS